MRYNSIYITANSEEEARKIGRALVEERLAACVNMFPIQSVYRWKGDIEEGPEVAMLVKTKADLAERVIARVKELHSNQVPCIVAFPIEKGYEEYLKWVEESTK
ncbi:MAG: divalent-cation tolerance protein CutA [Chloroflexi bacterium]|nr:divalent-cation tolerance protein CutA [Chloroflexota bacterium]